MKKQLYDLTTGILIIILILIPFWVISTDAPKTFAGSVSVCPGAPATIPITVNNFISISAISLRLDYNPQLMSYTSYSNINPALPGMLINEITVSSTLHKIIVNWSEVTPVTLPNGSKLMDLNFIYIASAPTLVFNNTSNGGLDCEYADENSDPMNDIPTANFYFNGQVTSLFPGPAGTITGPLSVCQGTIGVIYSVPPITNATGYVWSVPPGCTIVSGNNTNAITVNYSTSAVSGNISVFGTNVCGNGTPSSLAVTVFPAPIPTISGSNNVCVGTTGVVYTTQGGMTNYQWSVSSGGTITSGGGSTNNTVTVTWNTAGAQTVSVNYSNSNGCTASSPTVYNVTVNSLPVPTITGLNSVCVGTTGVIYTTQTGMTNYQWSVSAGGIITSGGGSTNNTVTVTWNTAGAQTVSVNYTNTNGCTASNPTIYNVTVNPLPVPTITGLSNVCAGTPGVVYTTQAGMTNYQWSVSSGGTITSGGGSANNTVTITWNTAGAQTVSVNYTNPSGCTATNPVVFNVTVNSLPVPTITGSNNVCVGASGVVYTTQGGMTNYQWSVSSGGTITSGGGTTNNTVTVTWNTAGAQTVSVNYSNSNGCTASSPTVYIVTVNSLPVPTITGLNSVCVGTTGVIYTTQTGMTNYQWSVSAGGIITSGGGSTNNTVTVTWNTAGAQTISVNYTNSNGCTASNPTTYNVTVNSLPVPTITGLSNVCAGTTGVVYTTQAGMTNYQWSVSSGGTITSGGGSANNTVTITWNTAGAQSVSVNYTNPSGCTATNPVVFNVTVNSLPVPTITGSNNVCVGVSGVVYTTQGGMMNYQWSVSSGGTITSGGGTTNNTVTVTWNTAGAQTVSVNYTNSNGCTASSPTVYNITVNSLPVPTITGLNSVCVGTAGVVYTTQTGMTNYQWSVSAGGIITSGGGSTNNTVTVTWNTAGAQTVSVNYTNTSGCTASNPSIYNVTVNPLPIPTITGSTNVCVGATGLVYTTEAGMISYVWNVSAGGTITSGGGSTNNSVTVTWNVVGAQTVSVSYTNANGCIAANPAIFNIIVNALPVPTINGLATVCQGTSGVVYTTEAGMTNYQWSVSSGGTITSGGGTTNNTVTVTWNTAGAQTVSVNYSNSNDCAASSPTVYNITVNTLPVPTITGLNSVCVGTAGVVYTTQTGMTNYQWSVSAGGIITSGGGSTNNTVTVTWNTAGAQTVSVNYTNTNGCTASNPSIYNITVNPLPIPAITGSTNVCVGATGVVYTTEAGMTSYVWNVSAGGTITSGGGSTNNSVIVTWNVVGAQTVSVSYTNANGCTAANPTIYNITVNALPVPTLNGLATVCQGTSGVIYTTEAGMTNYQWSVSSGGTITSGGGSTNNTATITWNTAGAQTVSVNYTNANGCTAGNSTILNVSVNLLPVPTINGANSICVGTIGVVYTTEPGMTSYVWTVSAGGTITSGGGSNNNSVTVTWNTSGLQTVSINYTNANGCTAAGPTIINVIVNPLPIPTLNGESTVCEGTAGIVYTTESGMTNYQWNVSEGGTITSGGGSANNSVTVTWNAEGSQTISVNYTNSNGCTGLNPVSFEVTVNPIPETPTISISGSSLESSAFTGNQWYDENGMINGATNRIYTPVDTGNYYVIVTLNGCSSLPSNVIYFIPVFVPEYETYELKIYPNPTTGEFWIEYDAKLVSEIYSIELFNDFSQKVLTIHPNPSNNNHKKQIDLTDMSPGIYTLKIITRDQRISKKIVITR